MAHGAPDRRHPGPAVRGARARAGRRDAGAAGRGGGPLPRQPAGLPQAEISEALDPVRFIAKRTLQGGPAPAESQRQAKLFGDLLSTDEDIVAGIKDRLAQANAKLRDAVDAITK